MGLTGHQIGLLKEYMHDLVEQARQEEQAHKAFGFRPEVYGPDQAVSDLLAILDDRIESEGVQVGLPVEFLHDMWMICNDAHPSLLDQLWFEKNVADQHWSKSRTRELTYRALLEFIERQEGLAPNG